MRHVCSVLFTATMCRAHREPALPGASLLPISPLSTWSPLSYLDYSRSGCGPAGVLESLCHNLKAFDSNPFPSTPCTQCRDEMVLLSWSGHAIGVRTGTENLLSAISMVLNVWIMALSSTHWRHWFTFLPGASQ